MFRMTENMSDLVGSFYLPFGGKLNPENRWVKLAHMIPWARVERQYAQVFESPTEGRPAYPIRVALGSLLIKERLGCSDRETVQQIRENPYLQFFIGYAAFVDKDPFHASLMTHFRERLSPDILLQINEWILEETDREVDPPSDDDDDPDDPGQLTMDVGNELSLPPTSRLKRKTPTEPASSDASPSRNQGKLLLDATCAPADIKYPTDLGLLNHAREILEDIIDTMHAPYIGEKTKPRTYRNKARKAYLSVAKQRKAKGKAIRKAIGQQLRYVRRDLKTIRKQVKDSPLELLSHRQYRRLLVIQELYRQQREMYKQRKHVMEHRIVSIDQPHVRPIVRGKAGASVEFGTKLAASLVDGYIRIERMQWDNFNEALTLQESVERYQQRTGVYPEAVHVDQIYRTRANLQYCKARGIRLSGPKLGRPPKEGRDAIKKQERIDAAERNAIEGKFGEGKRKLGLDCIRARLSHTSQTVIVLQCMVMNLERRLRILFYPIFRWLFVQLRPTL